MILNISATSTVVGGIYGGVVIPYNFLKEENSPIDLSVCLKTSFNCVGGIVIGVILGAAIIPIIVTVPITMPAYIGYYMRKEKL